MGLFLLLLIGGWSLGESVIPAVFEGKLTRVRGVNAGSKHDMEDLCAALSASRIQLDDIIDSVHPFEEAEKAIQYVWEGKQVGKVVLRVST